MTHHGISPRILDTLRQMGLTEYGARCYVALLSLKGGEASAVAEAAEVPRTKVYGVLRDLVDSGWVLAEGGRPVTYRAVAPDERIAAAEKRFAQDAADAARELQARFALRAEMLPVSVYLLRGRAAISAKAIELVSRAREDIIVNLGFALPGEAPELADALQRAHKRGVRVRMMLAPDVDARPFGDAARDARVALFPFRAFVPDERQALMIFPAQDLVGIWNPTQAAVEIVAPMLRQAWERAPRR